MAMTPEERKARDAQRKRDSRAKARAERDAVAAGKKAQAEVDAPRTMRDSVDESLAAMRKWLTPSDGAAVAQARELARMIDVLTHSGETTRALSAHGRLTRVLNDIGGTPTVRLQHELRSLRLAGKTEGADGGNDEAPSAPQGNVTKFERPAKRAR